MNARIRTYAGRAAALLALQQCSAWRSPRCHRTAMRRGNRPTRWSRMAPVRAEARHGATAPASTDDTGDPDSFGRSLQWLGLADGEVDLAADCTGDTFPCKVLARRQP